MKQEKPRSRKSEKRYREEKERKRKKTSRANNWLSDTKKEEQEADKQRFRKLTKETEKEGRSRENDKEIGENEDR